MPTGYRWSIQPMRFKARNWNLTGVKVEIGFGAKLGDVETVVRSTEAGTLTLIGVVLESNVEVSILECTLTEAETASWATERAYTIRVNEGSGWQVVHTGAISFTDSLKRST